MVGKETYVKLPPLFLNVYSTGKFIDVTGNGDLFFSSVSKPFLIEFSSYQK